MEVNLRKLWEEWQIRGLVLFSLLLQIILIIFGHRRKYIARRWITNLVWLAYLTADWVATLALGNIARSQGHGRNNSSETKYVLLVFWAPFLLLHLGGPDTITAYSLEDNELWSRHLLEFVSQVGVTFYVFFEFWSNNALIFIAISMFITGIIKYGERIYVLWSSSSKYFKDSLLSTPSPDPTENISTKHNQNPNNYLIQAYFLFKRSVYFFAGLVLDFYGTKDINYSIIHNCTDGKDAFKLVSVELGFIYDVLYTKASIIYSRRGIFLRCISFFSSVSSFIAFSIIIDMKTYSLTDIFITYVLLVGAIVLEIYALIVLLLSDRTKLWLMINSVSDVIQRCHSVLANQNDKRWSGSMAQYNLISFCVKDTPTTTVGVVLQKLGIEVVLQKLPYISEWWEKYQYLDWKNVDDDLQNVIFKQLLEKSKIMKERYDEYVEGRSWKELLDQRGDYVLETRYYVHGLRWSTTEVEFDHSLLVWHIATDLCYYDDFDGKGDAYERRIMSKILSDYMFYLLVMCQSMLPIGINFETKYQNTCDEAVRFFKRERDVVCNERSEACKVLLRDYYNEFVEDLSVLCYGHRLAKELQSMSGEEKWDMISEVWVEMLAYAANHCAWKEHGQQLIRGGEVLTHVCLLMAHLGLSEQYKMKSMPNFTEEPVNIPKMVHLDLL